MAVIITAPPRCVTAVFRKNMECLIPALRQKMPRRKKRRPDQKMTKHLQADRRAIPDIDLTIACRGDPICFAVGWTMPDLRRDRRDRSRA
jgi:hypothetical protein